MVAASDGASVVDGAEGREPAATPQVWLALLGLVTSFWGATGYESSSDPAAGSAAGSADPVAAAKVMLDKDCSGCHAPSAIQGKTVADIRKAVRDIPSMKRFEGKLTEAQLQALQQALAAEPGKD